MPRFREPKQDRKQVWLFPPSLEELVPLDSEVRLLDEAMDQMDWSSLEDSYSETGRPAYDPRIVSKVLVYAYCKGIRSSRRIEELSANDVRFMWLSEGERPDFHTIARFRKDKFGELSCLFVESVRLCARAGLVLLNAVAIDGTKLRADVSSSSLHTPEQISGEIAAIERILREAEEADCREDDLYGDNNGRQLPDEMRDMASRREKLAQLACEMREQDRKVISETDPECRLMRNGDGVVRACYNVQVAVDSKSQVIVAADVTTAEVDHELLPGMLEQVKENAGVSPDVVLADAGYSSESTLKALEAAGQDALIPASGQARCVKHNMDFSAERFVHDSERDVLTCPCGKELRFLRENRKGGGVYRVYGATGCRGCAHHCKCVPSGRASRVVNVSVIADLRRAMRDKLASQDGRKLFGLRKTTVEPVFGQMKHNAKFDRFGLRGMSGALAETYLMTTAHNVMKWVSAVSIGRLSPICVAT